MARVGQCKSRNRSLKMIGEIPSEVLKWIGGGHHAFGDDVHDEGNTHVNAIMGHVRTAASAGSGKLQKIGKGKGDNGLAQHATGEADVNGNGG